MRQNRRPCHNLPNSLCATAGGRRGPKFARMLLSLSATTAPELESRDGLCGALCGAKIYRWGSGSMNGTRAEPEKFGLGRLRCVSEDSQTPQKRGEAICTTS